MSREVSRRRFIARATLFAGASIALAACGGTASPTAAPAKPAEPTKPAAAAAPTPTTAPKPADAAKPAEPTKPVEVPKSADAAKPAAPVPTATPILAEAGKGSTVINFWNGLTGSDGQGMVKIMEGWAQKNPEVQVKIQMIVWRTFYDKLSASLVAGSPPEMWIFHSEQVIRYASKDLMKQVDDLAQGKTFPGQTIPIPDMGYTLPFAQYQGKTYSVPLDQYTWAIWFNKDLVSQAGLNPEKPPTTTAEFIEWGKRMTLDANNKKPGESGFDPKNIKQWGFYYSSQAQILYTMMLEQGVHAMIDGPEAKDVNTDSPEAIKALTEINAWRERDGFVPSPTGVNVGEGFWAGKVGMMYNGIWNTNAMKANPNIKTGVALTPQWYGKDPKVTFSGHQMAMPASLKDKKFEEAWKTIKYISDSTLDWAKEGQTPARKSILNSKEFQDMWPQNIFAQQLPTGVPLPPHIKLIELGDQITPALEAALSGQKKPDEALKEAAQRQRQILARRD